ncbi:hypothetical protein D917_09627 [Trichinella nativa]|uniref:Uncharacterized protein n=1 Tax=Trichinella nativa TaxID=6335 RepID=A0A1Y3EIJ5_9BILA|nr:hypothetical protein D917_09627 [Trichinella nativa]
MIYTCNEAVTYDHDASTPSSVADKDSLEGRRCERVKTLEEAKDAIAISSQVINHVVPPLANGDSGSDDSDIEYQPDNLEDTFDPAVQLGVEEELDMDKFIDIKLAQKRKQSFVQVDKVRRSGYDLCD